MKILIVGSGGREHVLAWKIKHSPLVKKIYCAPGNAGIVDLAECVDIKSDDVKGLLKFAKEKKIDLTVVGPEAPLVAGIVDEFEKEDLVIFGPSKQASKLEGSKVFSKEFMYECNIPTAPFMTFTKIEEALEFLTKAEYPLVVKADGLASGKGVIICKNIEEAKKAVDKIMKEKFFGAAGKQIVIEECLQGEELSILALCDGKHFCLLETAQDHKRIFDDDLGPNTGGMGAYSPTTLVDDDLLKKIETRIIEPTIRGMKRRETPFKGILYAGLMLTSDGPMVLEYNVRFGDPEVQAILPRLKNDIVELMLAACEERLMQTKLKWDKRACVCVVMSSGGYPGEYKTGMEIKGLDEAAKVKDVLVFHAGTKMEGDKVVTAGGRVLGVTALGETIDQTIERVYEGVEKIKFERMFFRRDIGSKALGMAAPRRSASTA
jgi:phosphoribosylamine---glycine ligase